MSELKPHNINQTQDTALFHGTVTDPKDFSEGGSEHRKAIIANTSLIVVLISSTKLEPALLGIEVSIPTLWSLVSLTHIYFFCMWRLTATIEADTKKNFWNFRGLYKQAFLGGSKEFPSKTKAQLFFLRALPIWAFVGGIAGIIYGFASYLCA